MPVTCKLLDAVMEGVEGHSMARYGAVSLRRSRSAIRLQSRQHSSGVSELILYLHHCLQLESSKTCPDGLSSERVCAPRALFPLRPSSSHQVLDSLWMCARGPLVPGLVSPELDAECLSDGLVTKRQCIRKEMKALRRLMCSRIVLHGIRCRVWGSLFGNSGRRDGGGLIGGECLCGLEDVPEVTRCWW